MRYVTIKKRLCAGMSAVLLILLSADAIAITLPTLPGGTTQGGTTQGGTTQGGTTQGSTNPLQTLTPIRQPSKFSTSVIQPAEPTISPMQTVTSAKLPSFNDYASAATFAANPANSCSATPTPTVCAVTARVSGIGSNYVTMAICPATHIPVASFGSNVSSPSGALYYSTAHTQYRVTYAQYNYYASNYYNCAVNWSDYNPVTQYSTLWDSTADLPNVWAGQYLDLNGFMQYINSAATYSYTSACHTLPHVPASCGDSWLAGWHSHQTYYRSWVGYSVYCTRNQGYYPFVNNPPYPFASYNAALAPIGTAATTTICGKAYNTFNRK